MALNLFKNDLIKWVHLIDGHLVRIPLGIATFRLTM